METSVSRAGPLRHRQYHLVERRTFVSPPPPPGPLPTPEREPPVAPLGPPPPLVPWSRLWPLLRAALSALSERHRVDLPRLVAAQARLRPLRRLPRLKARRWAPAGQLILDLHPRLYPFWGDFVALKSALPRLRGRAGLEILCMEQGPDGPVRAWDGEDWSPPRPYCAPAADIPVLIAGDLGCLGSPVQRQAWVRLGRWLCANGRRPVVLTPCPPRWWDPALAGLYFPVVLDRAAHIPARPAGARPWPVRAVELDAAMRGDPGACRLLTLLAACIAISPALLRHLRHRLPAPLADVGSEAAAWLHPARRAGAFALLPGAPGATERLQQSLRDRLDGAECRLAWELIRAQQVTQDATRAVRMEERLRYAAMEGRTDPQVEAFQEEVADALSAVRHTANREQERFLTRWVGRFGARMPYSAWRLSPRSEALWLLANPRAEQAGAALPSGFDIHRALAAQGRPEQVQAWRLVQRGDGLEVEVERAPELPFASGSPVVGRFVSRQPVAQVREDRPGATALSLPLASGAGLPLGETGWRLRSDAEELLVAPLERPAWAHTLGRDQDGLFVGFDDGGEERRAYWCGPGRGHPEWLGTASPSLDLAAVHIEHGFFLDEAQFRTLRSEGLYQTAFDTIGVDDYGLRGELRIAGIPLGFRWIWPGRFLMGSPPGEKGRDDNETRHEVILTQGLWLAETTCTQALWEAVMGKNPSGHKGPQLPVEGVSWDDVQGFLERLNTAVDSIGRASARRDGGAAIGLQSDRPFRLPTEAEWEYACRAGTTMAYAFGDEFDPKRANNGRQTVDVRSLPANPWGLYEMHGNVWEWCRDRFADYPQGPVVDPVGAETGGRRVLRGGGCFGEARDLRSASRDHFDPGYLVRSFGFRLARGPEPGQEGPGEGRPAPESGAGQSAQGASGVGRASARQRPIARRTGGGSD